MFALNSQEGSNFSDDSVTKEDFYLAVGEYISDDNLALVFENIATILLVRYLDRIGYANLTTKVLEYSEKIGKRSQDLNTTLGFSKN